MKHVHAELIKAWADGAEVEMRVPDGDWGSIERPRWSPDLEYRIKAKRIFARIAQTRTIGFFTVASEGTPPELPKSCTKWLSDIIELDVSE